MSERLRYTIAQLKQIGQALKLKQPYCNNCIDKKWQEHAKPFLSKPMKAK